MEQCCQRNVSGSRHLSHSKSSPRRRGTRRLQPPPQAGSRQGLRHYPPVTKPHSGINQTHCSGISPTPPGEQGLARRFKRGPARMTPSPRSHKPRTTANPGLPTRYGRQEHPPSRRDRSRVQCRPPAAQTSTSTSTSSRVSCPAGSSSPLRPHERQRTYRP